MPGQAKIFVDNSRFEASNKSYKYTLELRNIYKREKFRKSKKPIGNKFTHNSLDYFTYQKFSPYSDASLEIAIVASYKQIYGNLFAMESERSVDIERRLRNGDIPIREFIRGLSKSSFYRKNFVEKVSQKRSIELNFMHLLGRPLTDHEEIQKNIKLINEEGFEAHVDSLVNSLEYEEFFGEDIVPYERFWNSPCGAMTSSFINTALFKKGFASSDNLNL